MTPSRVRSLPRYEKRTSNTSLPSGNSLSPFFAEATRTSRMSRGRFAACPIASIDDRHNRVIGRAINKISAGTFIIFTTIRPALFGSSLHRRSDGSLRRPMTQRVILQPLAGRQFNRVVCGLGLLAQGGAAFDVPVGRPRRISPFIVARGFGKHPVSSRREVRKGEGAVKLRLRLIVTQHLPGGLFFSRDQIDAQARRQGFL